MKVAGENSQVKEYTDSEDIWTILRMILWSADYLAGKGVENSRLDSEWLLAYALDTELELKEGFSKQELEDAMKDHILAEAKLTGTFAP